MFNLIIVGIANDKKERNGTIIVWIGKKRKKNNVILY